MDFYIFCQAVSQVVKLFTSMNANGIQFLLNNILFQITFSNIFSISIASSPSVYPERIRHYDSVHKYTCVNCTQASRISCVKFAFK